MNLALLDTNLPSTLIESLQSHALRQPNKTAIIWYGRTISYSDLNTLSDRCAVMLKALGVQSGDRVAICMENCPQFFIAYFGIQKADAIVCPCSPLLKAIELKEQISDIGAKVIIAGEELAPLIRGIQAEAGIEKMLFTHYLDLEPDHPTYPIPKRIQQAKQIVDKSVDFLSLIDSYQGPFISSPKDEQSCALMLYTSGTTGNPKGAMLTYQNIFFKTSASAQAGEMQSDDIFLSASPIHHVSGLLNGLNIPIYLGATVVLHSHFSPESVLESIQSHSVSYWKGVAPMLNALINFPGSDQYDLTSLRMTTASSFGIPMTEQLAAQWLNLTKNCIASETGYGMSETHTNDVMMPPKKIKFGTHGKPLPDVQCRIIDRDTGVDLPNGSAGEILLKSPGNFIGYWQQPEMSSEVLRDGWLYTGDIGQLDDEGYLTFLGRHKQLIKISGYSVFPSEIETLMLHHPKILEVAVIGLGESLEEQNLKAFIVLHPQWRMDSKTSEILAWCQKNMAIYKIPRVIEFCDSLPKNAAGKILHRLLH